MFFIDFSDLWPFPYSQPIPILPDHSLLTVVHHMNDERDSSDVTRA
jgi:hypothetical protein